MSAPNNVAFNALNTEHTRWMVDGAEMADRGENDGCEGRPPASEHPFYYAGYRQGFVFGRAQARDCLIALSAVTRCSKCGVHAFEHIDKCGALCDNGADTARLQHGYFVVYGPSDPGDPPQFQTHGEIRARILGGLWVYDLDGDCLNPMFLVQ